jgi:hypothetical protein
MDSLAQEEGWPKIRLLFSGIGGLALIGFVYCSLTAESRRKRIEAEDKERDYCWAILHKEEGNRKFLAKDFSKAIFHYSKALELDEGNVFYIFNRAVAHLENNDMDACVKDCMVAIQLISTQPLLGGSLTQHLLKKCYDLLNKALNQGQYQPQAGLKEGDEGHREALIIPPSWKMVVKELGGDKGRRLIATSDYEPGQILFCELPLVSVPDLININCCAFCLRRLDAPLKTGKVPNRNSNRSFHSHKGVKKDRPKLETKTRAKKHPKGEEEEEIGIGCLLCNERYCSERCRAEAWLAHHRLLCPRTQLRESAPDSLPRLYALSQVHHSHQLQQLLQLKKAKQPPHPGHSQGLDHHPEHEEAGGGSESPSPSASPSPNSMGTDRGWGWGWVPAWLGSADLPTPETDAGPIGGPIDPDQAQLSAALRKLKKHCRRARHNVPLLIGRLLARMAQAGDASPIRKQVRLLPVHTSKWEGGLPLPLPLPPHHDYQPAFELLQQIFPNNNFEVLTSLKEFESLVDVVRTNCLPISAEPITKEKEKEKKKEGHAVEDSGCSCGLYPIASFLGRSNQPNASIQFLDGNHKAYVVADKPIQAGAEITIS